MVFAAIVGAAVLVLGGAPGCTPHQAQTPSFDLPASSFPDIVASAGEKPAEALAALDARRASGAGSIEAEVLRAHLLGSLNRHTESAAAWTAVGAAEPALAVFAIRAAAAAHLEAGNHAAAAALIDELMAGDAPADHTDLALNLATRHRLASRHDDARARYRAVLAARATGTRAEEARLGLAESLTAGGDVDGALRELRGVRLTFGNFEAYEAAKRAEARIARAASRPVPPVTAAEFSTMIDRLLARSRYEEAIALYEQQLKIEDRSGAARIAAAIIDTQYRARENSKARAGIREFRKRWPGSSYDDELTVLDFRIAIREARTADVKRLGYAIMRGRVQGVPTTEARGIGRLIGSYLAAIGELPEALEVFREMYQSSRSPGEQEDLLWRAGITALRAGELDRAHGNLQSLIARNVGAETTRIARFWIADIEARRGNTAAARAIWTELADAQPLEYYGLRSAARLGRGDVLAGAPPAPDLAVQEATLASPEMRAARVLSAAGLTSEAAAFARAAAEKYPQDLGIAYRAARASAAAGEYRAAHSLMARRFPSYITRGGRDLPPDFLKLFWPLAFDAHISRAGKRHGVDPRLMLSIARRESRYDPSVRSAVGAVGLFQFMPYTAEELAGPAGLTTVDEASLKTPATSARLAATYLKGLLDMFDGQLAPAASAYNAGEDLTALWWKAHKSAGADMFAEMIPYAETRGYVREVVANYETYLRLYPTPPAR